MAQKFPDEVVAIHELRRMFPSRPAAQLARQIYDENFPVGSESSLLADVACGYGRSPEHGLRTYYSVYSVVRRFDADQKALANQNTAAA